MRLSVGNAMRSALVTAGERLTQLNGREWLKGCAEALSEMATGAEVKQEGESRELVSVGIDAWLF